MKACNTHWAFRLNRRVTKGGGNKQGSPDLIRGPIIQCTSDPGAGAGIPDNNSVLICQFRRNPVLTQGGHKGTVFASGVANAVPFVYGLCPHHVDLSLL